MRVPRSAVSSRWTCRSGIRLMPQPLAQLVADERHRVTQRLDRGIALGGLADDADPDLGMPKVRRRFDLGDGDEADPWVGDVPRHDRADLLPKQLVDPLGSLAHEDRPPPGPPMRALPARAFAHAP